MTTLAAIVATWAALNLAAAATWSTIRGRQKRTAAARRRYTTEALTEAHQRLTGALTAPQSGQRA